MRQDSSENSLPPVWIGRPWILPGIVSRTLFVLIIDVLVVWVEFWLDVASVTFLGLQVVRWTALLFFLVWLFSLLHLVLLRASNHYILRNDSLEVRTGILTTKSFVVVPSGFSDLEVDRSVSGRMMNYGNIIIRSQSERVVMMARVRDPMKVAERIRNIMGRPIVRIEGRDSPTEKI